MSVASSVLVDGPIGRYVPQLDGLGCPSVARIDYDGIDRRCELALGHEGLCEAHEGRTKVVWGRT